MKYVRCYADSGGESHFEELEIDFQESAADADGDVPARAAPIPGGDVQFIRNKPGFFRDWHPTPYSWIGTIVQGRVEVTASDGESRVFGPGDVHVHEDETGKGHQTRVIGDETAVLMRTRLQAPLG